MTIYGRCKMNVILDQVSIYSDVVIAVIRDEVLLGIDILIGKDRKPVDIINCQRKIDLNGQEIRCQHIPQICNRKVRIAEDCVINCQTEQLVDCFIERCEGENSLQNSSFIAEPSEIYKENYPLRSSPSNGLMFGKHQLCTNCKDQNHQPFSNRHCRIG